MDKAPAPWHISAKVLNEHLIIMGLQGTFKVRVSSNWISIKPGTVLWIPPGTERELVSNKDSSRQQHFKVRYNHIIDPTNSTFLGIDKPFLLKAEGRSLSPIFKMLIDVYRIPGKWNTLKLHSLLNLLWISFQNLPELNRQTGNRSKNSKSTGIDDYKLKLINELLDNESYRQFSPRELASACGLSADYFSRIFKERFRISVRQFLKEERMRKIGEMITETDKPIKEIILLFGFNSESLFFRQFYNFHGCTPGEMRNGLIHKKIL